MAVVEIQARNEPLASVVHSAFEKLRASAAKSVGLDFDMLWRPTMDAVDIIARELADPGAITELTLIHPSSAMSVIAAALSTRVNGVTITAKRSIYDEPEDEDVDATESNTLFSMGASESLEAFVRRSVRAVRARSAHRFALAFDKDCRPTLEVADTLVEELLQSDVRELGLIHPTIVLDAIAASIRLRLPNLRVAIGSERKT